MRTRISNSIVGTFWGKGHLLWFRFYTCILPLAAYVDFMFKGDRINIALDRNGGTCTASNEQTPCVRAIDGREDPETSSWITDRNNPQNWIRVDLAYTASVDTVEILQHCRHFDKAKKILLEFSNAANGTVR